MSFFKDLGKLSKDFEGLTSTLTGDKKKEKDTHGQQQRTYLQSYH